MTTYRYQVIGRIRSCFTEKFGIPRQSGLVSMARAQLEILPPFDRREAFEELEGFSHIWILFVFHECLRESWKPTVRPPRMGGNRSVGVFASRSGFRPNPIGQSVVELEKIELDRPPIRLYLKGIDLLDGTPVLDIKPYLSYADSIPDARLGYANMQPKARMDVIFTQAAAQTCRRMASDRYPGLEQLICEVLALDPRPAYLPDSHRRIFGMRLWDLNVRFRVKKSRVEVTAVEESDSSLE